MKAFILAMFVILGLATGAHAATEKGRFDVYVQGQKVGDLRLQGRERGGKYSADLRLKMKGAMPATFEGKVSGTIEDGTYVPAKYTEKSAIAGRTSAATVTYGDSIQVRHKGGALDHWLGADEGTGLPDTATALWQLLQTRTATALCDLEVGIFDGARRMTLRTLGPKPRGPAVTCRGNLFREAGYSEDELAIGKTFAFEIEYAPIGDGLYRANRIDLSMPQGRIILVRR